MSTKQEKPRTQRAQWDAATYLTSWPEGLRETVGVVDRTRTLGIHFDKCDSGIELYFIDHLATGRKVGWATDTLAGAKRLAGKLLALGDWGDYFAIREKQGCIWELAIEADATHVVEG